MPWYAWRSWDEVDRCGSRVVISLLSAIRMVPPGGIRAPCCRAVRAAAREKRNPRIIGLSAGTAEQKQNVQRRLQEAGIAIGFSREYTGSGPDGTLRIAMFATHTPEMIDRLIEGMKLAMKAEGL